jgi:predicted amidohydrolase
LSSLSADPADLFCDLYDGLDARPFRDTTIFDWEIDEELVVLSDQVELDACLGRLDAVYVRGLVEADQDCQRNRYAVLRGIDRALAHAHPWHALPAAPAPLLQDARERYAATGRLNDRSSGALLPRFTDAWYAPRALEKPSQAFLYVVRVDQDAYAKLDHRVLENCFEVGAAVRRDGFDIATAPMIGRLDELVISTVAIGDQLHYQLAPKHSLRQRIAEVLARFDSSGAVIACTPEATLDDTLIGDWREAMTKTDADDLAWILIGTGPARMDDERPETGAAPNRAVMFSRRIKSDMFTQDKRSRFTLTAEQVRDWRLRSLPERDMTEYIALGDRSTVVETTIGRLAIAICEDAARLTEVGSELASAGVSLLFVPVFSKELRKHYWEDAAAKVFANGMGAKVVICNSLAVSHARREDPPDTDPFSNDGWGTAMLRGPGKDFDLKRSSGPTDVQCLKIDGKSLP